MHVKEAIDARRTTHLYREGEVDPAIIHEALTLALYAPNHKFTFPWKFLMVGPETRFALKELKKQISLEKKPGGYDPEEVLALDRKLCQKMLNPSFLVVFCCAVDEDDFRQREDYATLACSIQNFCLSLTSHGLGTKWSTGKVTRHPETYKLLGVDPSAFEIVGFVWVGYAESSAPPRKRPSLDEVLVTLP